MSAFLCEHCGAALEIPLDDEALDASCAFCNKHTPLPSHLLAMRARPVPLAPRPPSVRPGMILAGAAVVATLVVGIGLTFYQRAAVRPTPPVVIASATAAPSASPRRVVDLGDRSINGADAVSARLQQLHDRGCKDVILAPAQATGEQTLDAKLVRNGSCVNVIAMTGAADNVLTLTMTTPLGAPIEAPPASTSVELQVCPKVSGQHPTTIVPRTDAPYTVAAIECPPPKK